MKYTLLVISLLLCSCTLFKKTSKTKDVTTQLMNSQLKYDQLVLKQAGKETRIFTYWTDSGFYQLQHIKEEQRQAQSDQVKATEQREAKHTVVTKVTKPVVVWTVVGVILSFLLFRLYKSWLRV